MESDGLCDIKRAEAAPYVNFRPSPWWWVPGFALWFGVFVAAQDYSWSTPRDGRGLATDIALIVINLGLAVSVGVAIGAYQRRNGTLPSLLGRKPREIRRAYAAYFLGCAGAIALIVGIAAIAPWWVTGLLTFAIVFLLLGAYERYYTKAAAAARARLG